MRSDYTVILNVEHGQKNDSQLFVRAENHFEQAYKTLKHKMMSNDLWTRKEFLMHGQGVENIYILTCRSAKKGGEQCEETES